MQFKIFIDSFFSIVNLSQISIILYFSIFLMKGVIIILQDYNIAQFRFSEVPKIIALLFTLDNAYCQ